MPSNYLTNDPIQGQIDLDDKFITDSWLIDQFVGGTLFSWGANSYSGATAGALGNGVPSTSYSSPLQIGALVNWQQISCGYVVSSAIKTDGTLWAWGDNQYGQLGNGTTTRYSSPIQIGSLTNWKQVSLLNFHTLAIKTDGTLWAWGINGFGRLGNGNTINFSSPIQIGVLYNWKQVSAGQVCSAAIKTDGTLWTWGYNHVGQLGNNTTTNYSSPIQVGLLTNWKQVSVGSFSMAAVKTDGTLWTWGYNAYGELGNSSNSSYSSPIQVGSLTTWKQVSMAGRYFMAAIKTDGTLWACGYNTKGQLGNGTTINYSSPIQVGLLTDWKQLACGYKSTAAIKTDSTLWTWGHNVDVLNSGTGQLGNGTTISYSSPIQIGSLTNWKQVSSGWYHMAAITYKDLG